MQSHKNFLAKAQDLNIDKCSIDKEVTINCKTSIK